MPRPRTTTGSPGRYRDPQLTLWSFGSQEVLVVCPRCAGCAQIDSDDIKHADRRPGLRPKRLTCRSCGLTKDEDTFDPWVRPPLWLSIDCCGETLWAYNRAHLAEIRAYVEAEIRERGPYYDTDAYFEIGTMISWLPKWVKARKNRAAILKAIDKLAANPPECKIRRRA